MSCTPSGTAGIRSGQNSMRHAASCKATGSQEADSFWLVSAATAREVSTVSGACAIGLDLKQRGWSAPNCILLAASRKIHLHLMALMNTLQNPVSSKQTCIQHPAILACVLGKRLQWPTSALRAGPLSLLLESPLAAETRRGNRLRVSWLPRSLHGHFDNSLVSHVETSHSDWPSVPSTCMYAGILLSPSTDVQQKHAFNPGKFHQCTPAFLATP